MTIDVMQLNVHALKKLFLKYFFGHNCIIQITVHCTVSIMLVHNNDIEHDGADKMSYVFDYCYEAGGGVAVAYSW